MPAPPHRVTANTFMAVLAMIASSCTFSPDGHHDLPYSSLQDLLKTAGLDSVAISSDFEPGDIVEVQPTELGQQLMRITPREEAFRSNPVGVNCGRPAGDYAQLKHLEAGGYVDAQLSTVLRAVIGGAAGTRAEVVLEDLRVDALGSLDDVFKFQRNKHKLGVYAVETVRAIEDRRSNNKRVSVVKLLLRGNLRASVIVVDNLESTIQARIDGTMVKAGFDVVKSGSRYRCANNVVVGVLLDDTLIPSKVVSDE